jgi:hypothetical protein
MGVYGGQRGSQGVQGGLRGSQGGSGGLKRSQGVSGGLRGCSTYLASLPDRFQTKSDRWTWNVPLR